jgi:CheY-specific phosphatase CheX
MDKNAIDALLCKCWLDTTFLPIQSIDIVGVTDNRKLYIASIVYSGKSVGSMTIAMGESLATKVASMMFDCDIDSVLFDDIKDSVGELVNVLAGNMKTHLFGASELSKPLVMEGDYSLLSVLGSDVIFQESFVSDNAAQLIIQICKTG